MAVPGSAIERTGPSRVPAGLTRPEVLEYPSGTSLQFLLLIAMVALSGGFVGDWLYLSTDHPLVPTPPVQRLIVPPATVLIAAGALTLLMPVLKASRHKWEPVPADDASRAYPRYVGLVAAMGLSRAPLLVWNPQEQGSSAFVYGRPSQMFIVTPPALLGAARRRPAVFDAVVGHELAHVRQRDVNVSSFAVCVWYALIPLLLAPLLWRVVNHDLSLVPDYLWRVTILAIGVYLVRASLLRARESYADVRATAALNTGTTLVRVLKSQAAPKPPMWRRLIAWHPTPAARCAVIEDPAALGRLSAGELAVLGFTAMWTLPLLSEILTSGASVDPLLAAQLSQTLVFSLVGAYIGIVVARAAATGVDRRAIARASGGLWCGLSIGSVLSLANTGLVGHALGEFAASAVLGTVIAGLFVWAADVARATFSNAGTVNSARVFAGVFACLTAGILGLAANAIVEITEFIRMGSAALLVNNLPESMGIRSAGITFAAALAAVSVLVALVSRGGHRLGFSLGLGAVAGAMICVLMLVVELSDQSGLAEPEAQWQFFLGVVWMIVVAAVTVGGVRAAGRGWGRLADAAIGTAATVVIGAAVFVVTQVVVFGGTLGLDAFVDTIRWAGGITGVLAPVTAAAVWLTQPHHSEAGRAELAEYVTAYVPWIEEQRRHVWNEVAGARQLPMPAAVTGFRRSAVDSRALLERAQATQWRSAQVVHLDQKLLDWLGAESDLIASEAQDVQYGRRAGSAGAADVAQDAKARWVRAFSRALPGADVR